MISKRRNPLLVVLLLAAFTLSFSCKDDKSDKNEEKNQTEQQEQTNPAQNQQTTGEASSAEGDGKLNPKHGEPGHRCDIPVGAPLDSEPNEQPQIQTKQQSPVMNNSNTNSGTADGDKNPPHGQPGHRCDIPVGASLDQ